MSSQHASHRGSHRGVPTGGGQGHGRGYRVKEVRGSTRSRSPVRADLDSLGDVLDRINVKGLLVELEAPKIQNVEYISSYNWLDSKLPVVLVPGSPPAWTPLAEDVKLKSDSQDAFRDINAAHFPKYPMEPAIRSIRAMRPNFELHNVDIMGCGSTIGNLLKCAASQPRQFRFDLNIVGETLFLIRRENSPTEVISNLKGFGHTFPEAYTTWDEDVRNSCSHQRIVSYEFGGLQLLVRSETDGYVKQAGKMGSQSIVQPAGKDSLLNMLDQMSVSKSVPSKSPKLEVRMQGAKVPQDQIFDIKTRARYNLFDMNDILPRLWINQTPKFILAYHQFGLFNNPQVRNVRSEVLQWQEENSPLLARFHALLKRIVDFVRDSDDQYFEVSWDGEGPLLITRQIGKGRNAFPSDLWKS